MAAEVGSLFHFLSGYKEDQQKIKAEDPNIPITRDLLGGSKELDLDLDFQVPNGWEKRLDLKSGKVYMQQRCNSLNSSSSSDPKPKQQQQQISVSQLQDLNFPPNLVEEGFDLQKKEVLVFPSVDYQSVCTLDKVKSALERVERICKETIFEQRLIFVDDHQLVSIVAISALHQGTRDRRWRRSEIVRVDRVEPFFRCCLSKLPVLCPDIEEEPEMSEMRCSCAVSVAEEAQDRFEFIGFRKYSSFQRN
ncbi:putative YUP8H12R.23 protein [Cinnamomum micranthum f. kanehirae]|uniref:Putative YUP8H12R.23 protein n=1 Tax=Cinnamomum micranthum f. kanehirae TaxID=337451 RepID=A0A443Q236_9MAGN|nr:putative YUP8H12R.23 protein [Cinnamomum micranthum f. kanehirae]